MAYSEGSQRSLDNIEFISRNNFQRDERKDLERRASQVEAHSKSCNFEGSLTKPDWEDYISNDSEQKWDG